MIFDIFYMYGSIDLNMKMLYKNNYSHHFCVVSAAFLAFYTVKVKRSLHCFVKALVTEHINFFVL
jgi:hypothetical protein